MPTPKFYLFIFLLASSLNCIAQQSLLPKHEIGVSFFAFERSTDTHNQIVVAKWLPSLYFNRHFRNWTWTSSFSFGKNEIDDRPDYCGDCFIGIGTMTEFMASTGLQYRFLEKTKFPLKPFVELSGFYSHTRYAVNFSGGRSGGNYQGDYTSKLLGRSGKIGFIIRPVPNFTITASTAFRQGKGKITNNIQGTTKNDKGGTSTIFQLKIGYMF